MTVRAACVAAVLLVIQQLGAQVPSRSEALQPIEGVMKAVKASSLEVAVFNFDLPRFDVALREAARALDIEPTEKHGSRAFMNTLRQVVAFWMFTYQRPQVVVVQKGKEKAKARVWIWQSVEILRIRALGPGEASVSVRIKTPIAPRRFEFKLKKGRNRWKIFDVLQLDELLWMSEYLAAEYVPGIHTTQEEKDRLMKLSSAIRQGAWILEDGAPQVAAILFKDLPASPPRGPLAAARAGLLGKLRFLEGKPDLAAKAFVQAIGHSPDQLQANLLLAGIRKQQKRLPDALVHHWRYASGFGGDLKAFHALEQELRAAEDAAGLATAYARILEEEPRARGIAERALPLMIAAGRFADAAGLCSRTLDQHPQPNVLLLETGAALSGKGANEALLTLARSCRKEHPELHAARALEAQALRRLGRPDEAAEVVAEVPAAAGASMRAALLEQRAYTCAARRDAAGARRAAREAARLTGNDALPVLVDAWLEGTTGDRKKADGKLRSALYGDHRLAGLLQVEPTLAALKRRRRVKSLMRFAERTQEFVAACGRLERAQDWDGLVAAARKRLARRKRDRWGLDALGRGWTGQGNHAKAIATYEKAVKKAPAECRLHFREQLALALARAGRGAPALKEAGALVSDRPGLPRLLLVRAVARLAAGENADAARKDVAAALDADHSLARLLLEGPAFASLAAEPGCRKLAAKPAR